MAIPESQLDTWSHQGSITQSSSTYNTVKKVLEAPGTPYANKNYSVFLQGSYGNHTNIYAESDIDIVIKLDDCWQSDLINLSEEEKNAYARAFYDAEYTHNDFKRDVIGVLRKKYGSDVKPGSKAVAIAAHGNRRKSDVIIAIQFRRYFKFKSTYDQLYEDEICFYNSAGERISNLSETTFRKPYKKAPKHKSMAKTNDPYFQEYADQIRREWPSWKRCCTILLPRGPSF